MNKSTPTDAQNRQSAHESEEDVAKRESGHPHKSSHDEKSRVKAGKDEGAGGGAKQKEQH